MIDMFYLGFQILAALIIFITVWGFVPLDYWWVRGVDFPRIQFLVMGAVAFVGMLFFVNHWDIWQWVLTIGLILAIAYQLRMVLPYTKIWKKEVLDAKEIVNPVQIKLMVSNVLTPNDNTDALVELVQKKQPDILITLESDMKWQKALEAIEPDYPYTVKVPLDNLYGMHLYSKLELIDPEIKFLLIDDIPSIHTQLKLPNNEVVWLYCLHPMPPSPTEADKSTTRDAELLLVGQHIKENDHAAILAGDLNDVAWSKTTRMFQRISELLDPRIGRSFINTFHVDYPFLRWALDHLFHSPCFTLVDIERQPSIGSDHFPVMTILQYEPSSEAVQTQNTPIASYDDKVETSEKIEEGVKEGVKMSIAHSNDDTINAANVHNIEFDNLDITCKKLVKRGCK